MQRPIREGVAPRAQTAPEPPRADVRERRRRAPEPAGDGPPRGRPVRVRLVRVGLHRLVHARGPVASSGPTRRVQERYREVVSQVRTWDAELPSRTGQAWVTEHPQPDHAALSAPTALARGRRDRARVAEATGLAGDRRPLGRCRAVLLIHAASQGVAPEFALPLYPLFIVTALGALAGELAGRLLPGRAAVAATIGRVSRGRSTLEERTGGARRLERRVDASSRDAGSAGPPGDRHPAGAALAAPRLRRALALPRAARDVRLARRQGPLQADVPRRRLGDPRARSSRRSSTSSSSAGSRSSPPGTCRTRSSSSPGVLPMQYFASALTRLEHEPRREPASS